MTSEACVVLYRIHKYIATVFNQVKVSTILIALLYHDVSFTIRLGQSLFRVQKPQHIWGSGGCLRSLQWSDPKFVSYAVP